MPKPTKLAPWPWNTLSSDPPTLPCILFLRRLPTPGLLAPLRPPSAASPTLWPLHLLTSKAIHPALGFRANHRIVFVTSVYLHHHLESAYQPHQKHHHLYHHLFTQCIVPTSFTLFLETPFYEPRIYQLHITYSYLYIL
jgi:hypothetical protein